MSKIAILLATAFLASPAFAQAPGGVTGKWTGETQGRNGTQPVVLELKASGATLTGSMTTGTNPAADIKSGTVAGAKISFNTTRTTPNGDITIKWTGEAKGDDLTLNREISNASGAPAGNGPPPPVTLKRAK
jgi:hypothetical protein